MSTVGKKPLRCAVFARKSTEEGLDQEFNSIDAQKDAGHAYVASQKHEGWTAVRMISSMPATPAATWSGRD